VKTQASHNWKWTGPDGRNYDVFDFPLTDTDGSTLILEMGIDVTDQKQAEEALMASSRYVRSLIEASLDPLVTISADGKVTDVNRATELVTGVSREKLIGSDFSMYFTEPEKAREGYETVFSKGSVRDYPLPFGTRRVYSPMCCTTQRSTRTKPEKSRESLPPPEIFLSRKRPRKR